MSLTTKKWTIVLLKYFPSTRQCRSSLVKLLQTSKRTGSAENFSLCMPSIRVCGAKKIIASSLAISTRSCQHTLTGWPEWKKNAVIHVELCEAFRFVQANRSSALFVFYAGCIPACFNYTFELRKNILDVMTGFCQEYMFKHDFLHFFDSVHNSLAISGDYRIFDCSLCNSDSSPRLETWICD